MGEERIDLTDTSSRKHFLEEYVVGRDDVYAIQTVDGRYMKSDDGIGKSVIPSHLDGFRTIGVYQLDDGYVHWVCYDVDNHGGDNDDSELERRLVQKTLTRKDVPFLTEASGSPQSYHIWVFFEEPVPVEKAYYWAQSMICVGNERVVDCEIFPKQKSPKEYGNLVKVPLGKNRKTSVYSHFLSPTGKRLDAMYVETIDISDYEIPKLETVSRCDLDNCIASAGNEAARNFDGVRPCFKELLRKKYSLTGTEGHFLRIALAAEAWRCTTMDIDGMVKMYMDQGDFDYEKTKYQIESVKDYNRTSCETLLSRAPVAMGEMCKECKLNGNE